MTNRVKVYTTQLTKEILWSSPRPISTAKLNASPHSNPRKKLFSQDEGEYVEFEEIKD